MKTKLLISCIAIILLVGAGSGYIYSLFTINKLEKAMRKPIQVGFVTLYPGTKVGRTIGYFASEIVLEDSKIEFGQNSITIPIMKVGLSGANVVAKADSAEGIPSQIEDGILKIKTFK